MNNQNAKEKRLAAEVLALALGDLCPKIVVIATGMSKFGFFCDFCIKDVFSKEFFPPIEERMRHIAKSEPKIEIFEMVPQSAVAYLKHNGFIQKSAEIENASSNTIYLVKIGSYVNRIEEECSLNFSCQSNYKILDLEAMGTLTKHGSSREVFRLHGCFAKDSYELKKKIQLYKTLVGQDHLHLGETLGFFKRQKKQQYREDTHLFWTSKGEDLKYRLVEVWRKLCKSNGYECIISPKISTQTNPTFDLLESHLQYFLLQHSSSRILRFSESKVYYNDEGDDLYRPKNLLTERSHIFCSMPDLLNEYISSLQFIQKMTRILCFDYKWVLLKPRKLDASKNALYKLVIDALGQLELPYEEENQLEKSLGIRLELRAQDLYEQYWSCGFIEVVANFCVELAKHGVYVLKAPVFDNQVLIIHSAFESLERIIALLLEQKKIVQVEERLNKMIEVN